MKSFFSNLKLVSELMAKTEKYSNRLNIDRSAMYYVSMDLTRQALQTNGKLFPNFGIIFRIGYNFFFLIIVALDLCKGCGGGICLISTRSIFYRSTSCKYSFFI